MHGNLLSKTRWRIFVCFTFKEANCEVPACSNQEEVPSQLRKGKSLPKWISSVTQVGDNVVWGSLILVIGTNGTENSSRCRQSEKERVILRKFKSFPLFSHRNKRFFDRDGKSSRFLWRPLVELAQHVPKVNLISGDYSHVCFCSLPQAMVLEGKGQEMKIHPPNCATKGTQRSRFCRSVQLSVRKHTWVRTIYFRVKTKKTAENTLYCLSPEELLQTAEEILEEVRMLCDIFLGGTFLAWFCVTLTFVFFNFADSIAALWVNAPHT